MIPARPDPDCATSERNVFELLAAGLPASWIVLHGRKLILPATRGTPAQTCEIDFLLLDPARGLLALEVKGGGVQRESDDLWYSIDAGGTGHQIRNPQKRATRDICALRGWLREQPAFDVTSPPTRWAVVVTDITVAGTLGPELPSERGVDRTHRTLHAFQSFDGGQDVGRKC